MKKNVKFVGWMYALGKSAVSSQRCQAGMRLVAALRSNGGQLARPALASAPGTSAAIAHAPRVAPLATMPGTSSSRKAMRASCGGIAWGAARVEAWGSAVCHK